jgi:hypothetical protein
MPFFLLGSVSKSTSTKQQTYTREGCNTVDTATQALRIRDAHRQGTQWHMQQGTRQPLQGGRGRQGREGDQLTPLRRRGTASITAAAQTLTVGSGYGVAGRLRAVVEGSL